MKFAGIIHRGQPKQACLVVFAALVTSMLLLQGCGGGSSDSYTAPTLKAINIAPSTEILPLAGTRQLFALGTYSDGSVQDLSSQVTWAIASGTSSSNGSGGGSGSGSGSGVTNYVSVNSTGMVSGLALGSDTITATMGNVVGVLSLVVGTNGFSSTTTSILIVPYGTSGTTFVDAAYQPQSHTKTQGAYTVDAVNLDADQFSSVLPPPTALIASIPMPAGYVPNATAANQATQQVAVISYSSPDIQIIDGSNQSSDANSNTLINTFTAPIKGSVTFNGITCTICAAVVNPIDNHLILDTAEGYYSMDMSAGTFTPLTFSPPAFPAPSFTLNAAAASPYILSPTFGQDPAHAAEVQTLDLTKNTSTTDTNLGLLQPDVAVINPLSGGGAVTDAGADSEALLNLSDPQSPTSALVPAIQFCSGEGTSQPPLNMAALGIKASATPQLVQPTLVVTQSAGSCVGFEIWGQANTDPLNYSGIFYGYGTMPLRPDGKQFVNATDPNAIGTFTSVVDKKNYGFLVTADQNYIAKINLNGVTSTLSVSPIPLPTGGVDLGPGTFFPWVAGQAGSDVIYLSTYLTTGVVNVTTNSTTVTWVSGYQFVTGTTWERQTISIGGTLPGCIGGTNYTILSVTSATQLTLTTGYGAPSGPTPYCFP